MRAIKINFGGAGNVSIDWGGEVSGLSALGQKAAVAAATMAGSDHVIPARGTQVAKTLFSYGAFDILSMQHTLNFGALKARRDIQAYEESSWPAADRVRNVKMTLINVKDNVANVSVSVTNQAGQSTREILEIT